MRVGPSERLVDGFSSDVKVTRDQQKTGNNASVVRLVPLFERQPARFHYTSKSLRAQNVGLGAEIHELRLRPGHPGVRQSRQANTIGSSRVDQKPQERCRTG